MRLCAKCGKPLPRYVKSTSSYCHACDPVSSRSLMSRRWFRKLLIYSALFVAVMTLSVMWENFWSRISSQPNLVLIRVKVIDSCQQELQKSLKAPSTAKFSSYSETEVAKADADTYLVNGWVDAQNSFGAVLRARYFCTAGKSGDDSFAVSHVVMDSE
jgi:hypothetical protein